MFRSYAQNFEDVIRYRALRSVPRGFYIDIGASHPDIDSVSRAFHEKGWSGIHVEPLAAHAAALRLARPGDIVIEAVVSQHIGTSLFLMWAWVRVSVLAVLSSQNVIVPPVSQCPLASLNTFAFTIS